MWVKINESYWNLNSVARLSCDEKTVGSAWAKWVFATVLLASGKEVGVSEADFDALAMAIEKSCDENKLD